MSYEHPDVHGNWSDAPLQCWHCKRTIREEGVCTSDMETDATYVDEPIFCSYKCVDQWEQDRENEESDR